MKYVKSFKIYENENIDNDEALYEFDLPGFWEIFGAGAAWEAGKAIGALALALLAIGGVAVAGGLLQIKDKISELISERKRVKGAAEGQDFLLKNPKIQELAKISKELWKAQAGKVDKRRKDWEEKLSNLKSIAKDLTKKRQDIAKEIAADIKDAGLSKEAVEYLGTQVSYLGTSYFTKTLMRKTPNVNEGRKTLQIKRKYTDKHPSKSVGKWAPIREAILRHVKENGGTISKEDLMKFIKGMNEEKGTRTSWDWVRRNSRYLKETKNGYKITSIGERVLKATSLNESLLLTEGQFSWLTHDTNKQIGSERANTIFVTMFDDKGNKWEEKGYDGYGEFGGKDYYILLAEMNGVTDDNAEELVTKHKITVFGKGTLDDMKRQLGIDLAFENTKKLAVDIAKITGTTKIKYPALYEYPRKFNKNAHDFHREADNDPNQSWYVEDEYDDEDYY